jgi:hypothetical protein
MFQETANNQFFQGRYVLHYPFNGEAKCDAGKQYQRSLHRRFEQELQILARLTGWNIQDIRKKNNVPISLSIPWWRALVLVS